MKSDTTFQIELDKLQDLMTAKDFEAADTLVTRMLDQYNRLDYELLLKRARIRQCQMKYEDAIPDANLAHNILPQKLDAYFVLSDFLMALNEHEKALKLLEILHKNSDDPIIKSQYEMIKQTVAQKKP
jgi:tetratricopeptide (TPR) repeat protein